MKKLTSLSILITCLSGCSSGVKETLGIKKTAPDEFYVVSNPDLTVPPDFTLVDPSETSTREDTYEASAKSDTKLSNDDKEFLNSLSDSKSKSSVKRAIDQDQQSQQKGAIRNAISKISGEGGDPKIDPVAERERIKANQASDKPLNEGDVKEVKQSTIERILN